MISLCQVCCCFTCCYIKKEKKKKNQKDSNTEKLLEEKPTQPIQKQNETLKQEITSRIALDDCINKQKDTITIQKKNYIYNQEEINRKLSIDKLFNTQV